MTSTLIGCSHGTSNLAGRFAISRLLDGVRAARPELPVREAFVDVQQPEIAGVVDEVAADGDAVVVPLLLSTGYHVRVDISRAVRARADSAVSAGALGPDPRLVEILVDRLVQAGTLPGDAVVLAAAGSSDPNAARDVEELAGGLRAAWPGPVTVGYGASAAPLVPDAVRAAREAGADRVAIASYLLAPGYFHDRLLEAGADLVSAPLAPDPRLVGIVLERYEAARAELDSRRAVSLPH